MSTQTMLPRSQPDSVATYWLALRLLAVILVLILIAACSGTEEQVAEVSQAVSLAGLRVTLEIDRASTAANKLNLRIADATGNPVPITGAKLRLLLTEHQAEPTELAIQLTTAGQIQAQGQIFSQSGRWIIETLLERTGEATLSVAFAVPIVQADQPIGTLPLLPTDPQALSEGQRLYVTNCTDCHATDGRGTEQMVVDASAAPVDFTRQMLPGVRTDGQIFLWTKQGIAGTSMPGYGLLLDDTEIWQLTAYLRGFGQPGVAQATRTPAPTPTPPVPDSAEPLPPLVFVRQSNLWRSAGDGSPVRQLTNFVNTSIAQDPAISPQGDRIAFVVTELPQGQATEVLWSLYSMNSDGSELQRIGQPSRDRLGLPTWSADGQSLLISLFGTQTSPSGNDLLPRFEIARVSLNSGTWEPLVTNASDATLSADGTALAYVRTDPVSGVSSLEIAAADGSNARTVVGGEQFLVLAAPRFALDGTRLVFAGSGGPTPQGKAPLTVLEQLGQLIAPAVAEAHGAPQDLWIVQRDGTGLRRLTTLFDDEPRAVFSADGTEIVLLSASGLYRMFSDGSELRRIDRIGDHGGLDWIKQP